MINIDFEHPEESNWTTLIPEHSTDVLDCAICIDTNKLIISFIHDVQSVLNVYNLDNGALLKEFSLPIGSIANISGQKESSEFFFHFISFLTPGITYYYDFSKNLTTPEIFHETKLNHHEFDSSSYSVEQVFYESKDKTKIPMFIVSKKQVEPITRPCLLYGYGGFNISILPMFSITWMMFMDEYNGVLAFPNLRGGG